MQAGQVLGPRTDEIGTRSAIPCPAYYAGAGPSAASRGGRLTPLTQHPELIYATYRTMGLCTSPLIPDFNFLYASSHYDDGRGNYRPGPDMDK